MSAVQMTIEFKYFVSNVTYENLTIEQRVWLNKNIGRQGWQINGPGAIHPYTISFQLAEDALAFKIKFKL